MKQLCSILFLISACAASIDDDGTGDGDGDDAGPGAGNATVRFRLTTIHDERGDVIEYSTGEPVHAHAGAPAQLGGDDCTDVYKHSYLMDATAPKFGRETSPNALAWKIEAKGAAEYRVRAGDSAVRDWTRVDDASIALHRDIITSGQYFLDVRVGVAIATTCWNHHPLAAPVEVQAARPDASGLAGMSFAARSPMSQLLAGPGVRVFAQRFVHHTSEPVTLSIDVSQPTGTIMRRAVDDFVIARTGPSGVLCSRDSDGFESGEPICTETSAIADPVDSVVSAALTSGAWSLQIVDEATGTAAANCAVSNLHASCRLIPRATTGASQAYRIVLSVRDVGQLAPSPAGPSAEHTIAGATFTGRVLESVQRCGEFKTTTKFGVTITTCETFVEYTHIHALDRARIVLDPVGFMLASSAHSTATFAWDAGDADLPGPQ